jgi:hypothetical protein
MTTSKKKPASGGPTPAFMRDGESQPTPQAPYAAAGQSREPMASRSSVWA